MAGARVRRSAVRRNSANLLADFGAGIHDLARSLFDPYRPELHYMRGPGPKWHAKHRPAEHDPAPAFRAMPTLIRLRAKA